MMKNPTWYTVLNGRTENHKTKRIAVVRVRNFLGGEHAPITRHDRTYTVNKEGRS